MQTLTPPSNSPAAAATADARPGRARVLIVGCGFGGLEATRALAGENVDVTVIEKTNHHLFQPLLYQVATAGLAAPSIAAPARTLFRRQSNVTTLLGEVTAIDAAARQVQLADGERLPYEHLIVAAGATHSYFGNDDWATHAPGLKTLADAFEIRRRVLLAFEAAEREHDAARRQALLRFVVIGAGPTGVEMAGTLAEIARHTLTGEFRRIRPADAEVLLVEGGSRVLQAMPEALSQRALEQLEALGVRVRLNTRVTRIDEKGLEVTLDAGTPQATSQFIDSRCITWAAGVAASPLGRLLAQATGAECDRAGRVKVEPDLSLAGHSDISVVGDLAAAVSHVPGQPPQPVPGVSPGAKQMGRCAAGNVLLRIAGLPTRPFRYRDWGNLATIGRHSAVADVPTPFGHLRFSGSPAWLFWLFVHIFFLIGFRNRMIVLMDWASAYWTFRRHARVVHDVQAPQPAGGHAAPPPSQG
ncbi:NAD(P)/FAD-dependent oxidoreductase [Xenophilus arseniciresistens]|uniref:NADH:ubiquinone reductase (non-electrogenic) n=1 Tax=Xenophilus arseniciresistens TaxID=1283306 RepID=A0AAE3NBQ3_9BURK|nr:NAD(P)/FAD-dependent oxidoreductase [Xenophilus arseniciresistens]MDA7417387.1 NAD(P)/FAD-dependent oxidoreductase [Xenophilus arseniciresistens]